MFDVNKAIEAQKNYCKENEIPHFAPYDGRCYRCHKQIYEEIKHDNYSTGITVEEAGSGLVTGCPHCHYSFVD